MTCTILNKLLLIIIIIIVIIIILLLLSLPLLPSSPPLGKRAGSDTLNFFGWFG